MVDLKDGKTVEIRGVIQTVAPVALKNDSFRLANVDVLVENGQSIKVKAWNDTIDKVVVGQNVIVSGRIKDYLSEKQVNVSFVACFSTSI